MERGRFSIAGHMILVLVAALGLGLLRNLTVYRGGIEIDPVVVVFLVGLVNFLLFRRGRPRAYWAGFSLAGLVFLISVPSLMTVFSHRRSIIETYQFFELGVTVSGYTLSMLAFATIGGFVARSAFDARSGPPAPGRPDGPEPQCPSPASASRPR